MHDIVEQIEVLIDDWFYGVGESARYSNISSWLGWTDEQYIDYIQDGTIPEGWEPPEWTR